MTLEQLAALQVSFIKALDGSPSTLNLPDGWFDSVRGDGLQRFSRYRSGLWQHQEQSLGLTYPVIKALVGDDFFRTLAYAYGRRYPSQHPDLRMFGEHLSVFLDDYPAVRSYPYFAAVAALEWSIHCAAYAADAIALNARDLAAMNSRQVDSQRFTLHPSCTLLHSEWPSAALWTAHVEAGQPLPNLQPGTYAMLVYRRGWEVKVRELAPCEEAALTRIRDKASLSEALLAAQERFADSNPAPLLVDSAALVTRWLNDAVLVAVTV